MCHQECKSRCDIARVSSTSHCALGGPTIRRAPDHHDYERCDEPGRRHSTTHSTNARLPYNQLSFCSWRATGRGMFCRHSKARPKRLCRHFLCFKLQDSRIAVVSSTAAATLRQLVMFVVDKMVEEDKQDSLDPELLEEVTLPEGTTAVLGPFAKDAY